MISFSRAFISCLALCALAATPSLAPPFSSSSLSSLLPSAVSVSASNVTPLRYSLFGSGDNEYGSHCASGDGSGYYVVGTTSGQQLEGNANPTEGSWDAFVAKYNNARQQIWLRFITSPQEDRAMWCDSASDGSVVLTGFTRGNLDINHPYNGGYWGSQANTFVAKYDAAGNQVYLRNVISWNDNGPNRIYLQNGGASLLLIGGLNGYIYVTTLSAVDPNDNTSPYYSYNQYGPQYLTFTNVAFDVSGRMFISAYGSYSVASISNAVTGQLIQGFNNAGSNDGWVYVFDSTLSLQQILPQSTANDDRTYAVTADVTGSIYVTGSTTGNYYGQLHSAAGNAWTFVQKYSADGSTLIWTRLFGPNGINGAHMFADNLGAIYIHRQDRNCALDNCWGSYWSALTKLDVNGNSQWEDSNMPAGINNLVFDSTATITASGSSNGNAMGVQTNNWDMFIYTAKLNYNCSCGDLANLVNDVTNLLNIVPY